MKPMLVKKWRYLLDKESKRKRGGPKLSWGDKIEREERKLLTQSFYMGV